MRRRWCFIVIPCITIVVAVMGHILTNSGMDWYQTLNLPPITPKGKWFGPAWTGIFIFATIAALYTWTQVPRKREFKWIIALLIANAILNVFWSYLFFHAHSFMGAFIEMIFLNLTVLGVMIFLWRYSVLVSLLLLPYLAWVAFANYLTYAIWMLNP